MADKLVNVTSINGYGVTQWASGGTSPYLVTTGGNIKLGDTKAPPTETIMRFKVPVRDAEAISEAIGVVTRAQGFDGSNALTNAGDALVWLLLQRETENDTS